MLQTRIISCIALLAAFLSLGCVDECRDWKFVQDVGGMSIGTPSRNAKSVSLPIRVDVSGFNAITQKPRLLNSGLALKEIRVQREGNTVVIALITTLLSNRYDRTTSPDLDLGNLQPGHYMVVYQEPSGGRINVGEFDVAP